MRRKTIEIFSIASIFGAWNGIASCCLEIRASLLFDKEKLGLWSMAIWWFTFTMGAAPDGFSVECSSLGVEFQPLRKENLL